MAKNENFHLYDPSKVGTSPRGHRLPDTLEGWRELADAYARHITKHSDTLSKLRERLNQLEQKLESCRRKHNESLTKHD